MSSFRARVFALLLIVAGIALLRVKSGTVATGARALGGDAAAPATEVTATRGARARWPSVPRLIAPGMGAIGEASDEGPEPAAGNDELDVSRRAEIDELEQAVRAEATAAVGLSDAERLRIAEIRADLDARRGRFETQIDPVTHMLEPHASAAILGNARAEQRALEHVLGPERAAALRDATSAAYARLIVTRHADTGAAPAPAVRRMLARRMGGRPIAKAVPLP